MLCNGLNKRCAIIDSKMFWKLNALVWAVRFLCSFECGYKWLTMLLKHAQMSTLTISGLKRIGIFHNFKQILFTLWYTWCGISPPPRIFPTAISDGAGLRWSEGMMAPPWRYVIIEQFSIQYINNMGDTNSNNNQWRLYGVRQGEELPVPNSSIYI